MSRNLESQDSLRLDEEGRKLQCVKKEFYFLAFIGLLALVLHFSVPRGSVLADQNLSFSETRPRSIETSADSALLAEVSGRILAVIHDPPSDVAWPPDIRFENKNDLNAYATIEAERQPDGKWKATVDRNGKYIPYVVVDQRLMNDVIQGDPDRLAMVVGHELSHILLRHVLPDSPASKAKTRTFEVIFTSEQEHKADINGIKLALAAGYTYKGARDVWEVWNSDGFKVKYPQINYTSFESVGLDHPSWTDRLSYIDKEKANVWKAMSAFENGVLFLNIEQYAAAEEAFTRVVNEFPDNYEGWANLGYARLMMYLDAFDVDDLKRYDIGQLVVGSFYQRPEAFRAEVRGINDKVWQKAVSALKKSLELKPDLALAKANLGVAYLLNPSGRDAKMGSQLLEQAVALLDSDKKVDHFNRAAVLINAAVADLANGQADLTSRRLDQAKNLVEKYPAVSGASDYNRAMLAIRADASEALPTSAKNGRLKSASFFLTNFLETTTPASVWWGIGYEKYAQLMKKQGLPLREKADLSKGTRVVLRPVTSVELAPGTLVTLSDPTELVKSKIKPLIVVPVAPNTIEMLHHMPTKSDLLVGRRLLAIFVHGPTAPRLQVQSLGIGAKTSTLSVGMSKREVEKLLGTAYLLAPLNDPTVNYYFYPELGVGMRYGSQDRVTEMVLAQIVVER